LAHSRFKLHYEASLLFIMRLEFTKSVSRRGGWTWEEIENSAFWSPVKPELQSAKSRWLRKPPCHSRENGNPVLMRVDCT